MIKRLLTSIKRVFDALIEMLAKKVMLNTFGTSEIPEGMSKLRLVIQGLIFPPISTYILVFYVFPSIGTAIDLLKEKWTPDNALAISSFGVIITLAIGYTLYLFKKYGQVEYGLVEIIASAASCFYTFQKLVESATSTLGILVPIITSIYFTQRGLTNFFEGRKNKSSLMGKWRNFAKIKVSSPR